MNINTLKIVQKANKIVAMCGVVSRVMRKIVYGSGRNLLQRAA